MSTVPAVVTPAHDEADTSADFSTNSINSTARSELGRRDSKRGHHRRRSSSFVMVQQVQETPDQVVDQEVSPNANAEWVNMKGA